MKPPPWSWWECREACEEKCSLCWVYRTKVRIYFDKILPKAQEKAALQGVGKRGNWRWHLLGKIWSHQFLGRESSVKANKQISCKYLRLPVSTGLDFELRRSTVIKESSSTTSQWVTTKLFRRVSSFWQEGLQSAGKKFVCDERHWARFCSIREGRRIWRSFGLAQEKIQMINWIQSFTVIANKRNDQVPLAELNSLAKVYVEQCNPFTSIHRDFPDSQNLHRIDIWWVLRANTLLSEKSKESNKNMKIQGLLMMEVLQQLQKLSRC